MNTRPSWGAKLFRALLRLFPAEFRGDFGEAMAADVDGARERGVAFRGHEIRGLLGAAVREHFDVLRQDVKCAFRMMQRTPGFTAIAVVMLALGTGVNLAMFSIVDAVMLRSPFENPGELVGVRFIVKDRATWAVPLERYRDLLADPGPLAAVGAFSSGSHVLTGHGDPVGVDDIECFSSAHATSPRPHVRSH